MASTTRALVSSKYSLISQHRRWIAWVLFWLVAPGAVAEEFQIRGVNSRLVERVYLLDATIEYRFSREALEALYNGVPLTIRLEMEVERKRGWWWWDAAVATLEQRFQIHYHALSDQFVVRNLNNGAFYSYHTLSAALETMGTLKGFPLLDEKLVEPDAQYELEMRASLDIESLPAPLRPLAYITPAWRLASDWYQWSLAP